MNLTIMCLSDTHGFHNKINMPELDEKIDLILHAGDLTMAGKPDEVKAFMWWAEVMSETYQAPLVFIPGNHDFWFEKNIPLPIPNVHCLINRQITLKINGATVTIYGYPQQPRFFDWAFNADEGPRKALYNQAVKDYVASDYNIFLTHGPPEGILDKTYNGEHAGCELMNEYLKTVHQDLVLFGHIHEGRGMRVLQTPAGQTVYVNAAICSYPNYQTLREPIIIDLKELKHDT